MRSLFCGGCVSVVDGSGLGDGDAGREDERDEVGCAPIMAFSLIMQPSPTIIGPS